MRQAAQGQHGSQRGGHQAGGAGRKGGQAGQGPEKGRIGRPEPPPPPEQAQDNPDDIRHIQLLAQYENMQRLGRKQSFGLWAQHNGHGRDLLQPGQAPYDFLEDS